jgi:hypothetical protein
LEPPANPVRFNRFFADLAECMLTAKEITPAQGRFAGNFIDMGALFKQRSTLSRSFSPERASIETRASDISLSKLKVAAIAAEQEIVRVALEVEAANTLDAILSVLERNRASFQAARPQVLASRLTPVMTKLDVASSAQADARANERRTRAKTIMSGVSIPRERFPSARVALLGSVIGGAFSTPTRDEIGFLAGMFGESVDKCGKPDLKTRLMLTDLLRQGVTLGLGADYMGPISSSTSSIAAGALNFLEGSRFSESLGCQDPFVDAFFEALAATWSDRSQGADGRAPLYVRSCALDRSPTQCQCIMSAVEVIHPGISRQRYSRESITATIQRKPALVGQLGSCGLSNY